MRQQNKISMDEHGDRMKYYEQLETDRKFMKGLPIYARLDGHSFSKFTKPFKYPYDKKLRQVFDEVCKYMIEKYNARLAYHQSDEISLLFFDGEYDEYGNLVQPLNRDFLFGGKIQKLTSLLAAAVTSKFITTALRIMPEHSGHILQNSPEFDCRIFQVPNIMEAINQFVWRERDCNKNSVSMLARSLYSHTELKGKKRNDMLDMIVKKGDNWNHWDSAFKRGTYLSKIQYEKEDGNVRNKIVIMEVPPITKVLNKIGTLMFNETPILKE